MDGQAPLSAVVPFFRRQRRPLCPAELQILSTGTGEARANLMANCAFDTTGTPQAQTLTVDLNLLSQENYQLLSRPTYEVVSREVLFRLKWLCQTRDSLEGIDELTKRKMERAIPSLDALLSATDPEDGLLKVSWSRRYGMGRFIADFGERRNIGSPVGALINLARRFRNTIFTWHGYIDIDQAKSYPTLMVSTARLCGIPTPIMEQYLRDPDSITNELCEHWTLDPENPITSKDTKKLILRTMYGGAAAGWVQLIKNGGYDGEKIVLPKPIRNEHTRPAIYDKLKEECTTMLEIIYANNPDIAERLYPPPKKKTDPPHADCPWSQRRRVASFFFQTLENHFTYKALEFALQHNAVAEARFSWGYDGLSWIPTPGLNVDAFVVELNAELDSPYFPIKFVVKPIEHGFEGFEHDRHTHPLWATPEYLNAVEQFQVTASRKRTRREEIAVDRNYDELKEVFERDHFKVEQDGCYGREFRNDQGLLVQYTPLQYGELVERYRQWSYLGEEKGEVKEQQFIFQWAKDKNMRLYTKSVFAPPPVPYDKLEEFNTWTYSPYHLVFPIGAVYDNEQQAGIDMYLDLNRIAAGGRFGAESEYLLAWDCDWIQKPGSKTLGTMICCQGSEGSGKSLYGRFKAELAGPARALTTTIDRVVGEFNGILEGKILVVVEEMDNLQKRGAAHDKTSTLKSLVTEKKITYNQKNVKAKEGDSYHRWVSNSNDPAVFNSGRRPFYVKFANDFLRKRGNELEEQAKIDAITDLLDCTDLSKKTHVFSAIYHYLYTINMEERFGRRPRMPDNELNREQKASRTHASMFGTWFLDQFRLVDSADLSGAEVYDKYKEWLEQTGAEPDPKAKTALGFANMFIHACSWPEGTIGEARKLYKDGKYVQMREYNFVKMREAVFSI